MEAAGERFLAIAKADPAHLAAWDGAVDAWCRQSLNVDRCLKVLDLELDRLGSIARHHDALAVSLEGRASARLDAGFVDAALEDLSRAARAAPDRPEVPLVQARAHAMRGDREAAVRALERAAKLSPHHPGLAPTRALLPTAPQPAETEPGFGGLSAPESPAAAPTESSSLPAGRSAPGAR